MYARTCSQAAHTVEGMLQAIRDGIRGWIAWLIIGLIALPFLFMGGYEYFGGGSSEAVVARVDGEEIPRAEVEQAVERQRARLRELFGGELPDDAFDVASLRREALEQLIDEAVLQGYLEKQGLRVSDEELAQAIRGQTVFHEGGQFSRERYQALLERNRLTPEEYEGLMREDLKGQQFEQAVLGSSLVTTSQLERLVRLQDETRSLAYLEVPAERFREEVQVDEAEVEARYEERTESYMAPEAVRLAYVELGLEDLRDEAAISEEDLRSRYEQRYGEAEEPPDFETAREELEEQLLAERVGTELVELSEELGNLAFEHPDSLEPAASQLGLEVETSDWIEQGGGGEGDGLAGRSEVLEQAFSEEVLEAGNNSDLIQLEEHRYLVLRVREHRPEEPKPLEEVAGQIREEIRAERSAERARGYAEELLGELRDGETSLETLAEDLDTELFSASGIHRDDRGHPAEVVQRGFSLEEGAYALAELDGGAMALLRLDEVDRGDPQGASEQEQEQLRAQLQRMAGESEFKALIRALRAEADIEVARDRL